MVVLPSPIPSLHIIPGHSCSMDGVAIIPWDSLGVRRLCLKERTELVSTYSPHIALGGRDTDEKTENWET